jgi:cytochrome P450
VTDHQPTETADPTTEPPTGEPAHPDAVRLYGPEFAADPAALYHRMRERFGAVAPVLLDGDLPAWLLLDHRVVHEVTGNPKMFARDTRRWNAYDAIPADWSLAPYVAWMPSIMYAEGAAHQRRAGAVGDALDAFDRTELAAVCARLSDDLIDGFAGRGEADLIADYANRIPLLVIAYMYGFGSDETPALARDVADSLDEGEEANKAHQRIQARMRQLVADKHDHPGPDVPSRLLGHPAGLSAEEIIIDLLIVMAAAQQPTANWIGNTLRLMLVDDDFSLTLQGGRSSADHALNQVLWEDTPTQNFIGRFPVHDCVLAGQHIRKGDLLILGLAAANGDPRLRAARDAGSGGANRAHMSFGHGEHGCPFPAPELAEVIAKAAVEVLLDRLPDVRLGRPADTLTWHPSVWMRGLHALPVVFTPTRHTAS